MKTELLRKIRKDYYCKFIGKWYNGRYGLRRLASSDSYRYINKKTGKQFFTTKDVVDEVLGKTVSYLFYREINKTREQREAKKNIYKFLNDK